jgi:hypothetical protein
MRKALWIFLVAVAAIPMFTELASAHGRRHSCIQVCCAPPVCYAPPVYYAARVCYAPRVVVYSCSPYVRYAPVVYCYAPVVQQPTGIAEPRPSGPPKE